MAICPQLILLDERGLALSVATSFKIMGMFMIAIGAGVVLWSRAYQTVPIESSGKSRDGQ